MDRKSPLTELLSRARRRCVFHRVLDQSALALTIGLGGTIALLLAGTQILNWYWVVLLVVASLGVGLYRLSKTVPTTYKLAQRIDHGLNLTDALSTATYFSSTDARGDESIKERQRQDAEQVARTVDVRQAVPFARPQYIYPALGLAAVAFGLFAVRYAMIGSLDLQPSLVKIAFDTFFAPRKELAKANTKKPNDRGKDGQIDAASSDAAAAEEQLAQEESYDNADNPTAGDPDSQDQAKSDAQGDPQDQKGADKGDKGDKGDSASEGNDSKGDDNAQDENSSGGKEQNGKQQNGKQGSDKDSSSMMSKLKDAMSDMWSKMTQKDAPPTSNAKQGDKNNAQKNKSGEKNSQSQKNAQNGDSDAKGEQEQGDGGDQKQAAAGESQKGSDANAQPDSKSGIGSADGDKNAKEAAQLAAMGKISEILGKRSAQVTGEVMVEVGSSKQQLKTPWAQRQATHVEAGSEIHRDEVPLMYQQFVQQYFEEIRKSPEPAAKAPAPSKPATPQQ
ncbi:MAG: hypothetical protein ABSB35_11275 [Bryobacteraceae bacterium]